MTGDKRHPQAGARFGHSMLWAVVFTLPLMAAIQIVSARIGCVTRQGLGANIKERFARRVLLGVVGLLLAANTLNIAADIAALARLACMAVVFSLRIDWPRLLLGAAWPRLILLFSLGIIGSGLLAVPVLAGSAACAVAEGAGWRGSLSVRLDCGGQRRDGRAHHGGDDVAGEPARHGG